MHDFMCQKHSAIYFLTYYKLDTEEHCQTVCKVQYLSKLKRHFEIFNPPYVALTNLHKVK